MNQTGPRFTQLVLALVLIAFAACSAAAEPTPFRAVYKARYKGFPLSATGIRELRKTDDGIFLMSSSAKSFFVSIEEQTLFRMNAREEVVPIEYQYHRTGIGKNRTAILTFDWDVMQVLNDVQSQPWRMRIETGTQDKLSYQQLMRDQLWAAWRAGTKWPELTYQVADGGRVKEYKFEILGEEQIETPVGNLNTVKATRIRADDDRVTTFWLAPEYEFLLVRLEQVEADGDGFNLLLKEAEFGGKSL